MGKQRRPSGWSPSGRDLDNLPRRPRLSDDEYVPPIGEHVDVAGVGCPTHMNGKVRTSPKKRGQ